MLHQDLIENLTLVLKAFSHTENAFFMSKYLKGKFVFFGIKFPVRREIAKDWVKSVKQFQLKEIPSIAKSLWQMEEREYHYIALDLLVFYVKKADTNFINPHCSYPSSISHKPRVL